LDNFGRGVKKGGEVVKAVVNDLTRFGRKLELMEGMGEKETLEGLERYLIF